MDYKELAQTYAIDSLDTHFYFNVSPNKDMEDKSGNVVYRNGEPVDVYIHRFRNEEKVQIYYRSMMHKGNTHKSYPNTDALLQDFTPIQR